MTGDHVGKEPDRKGDRSQEENREELDQSNEWPERNRDRCRPHDAHEVAEALALDTRYHEHDPCDGGKHDRESHSGSHREVDERRHLVHVADEYKKEDAQEPLCVLGSVLADDLDCDVVPDEPDKAFDRSLELPWYERLLTKPEEQQRRDDDSDQKNEDHGPSEGEATDTEDRFSELEQFVDVRRCTDDVY